MLEPVDISQYEERLRNFIEPFVVGTRRRAAREYRFEVARLRSEWLRGFSDRRREMRSVTTAADAVEFRSAVREWDRRKRAWIERDGDVDGSDLDDLVRTIPGRCWLPPTGERLRELLDEAAALGLTEEGG